MTLMTPLLGSAHGRVRRSGFPPTATRTRWLTTSSPPEIEIDREKSTPGTRPRKTRMALHRTAFVHLSRGPY
jgi:hypothetical protein